MQDLRNMKFKKFILRIDKYNQQVIEGGCISRFYNPTTNSYVSRIHTVNLIMNVNENNIKEKILKMRIYSVEIQY